MKNSVSNNRKETYCKCSAEEEKRWLQQKEPAMCIIHSLYKQSILSSRIKHRPNAFKGL